MSRTRSPGSDPAGRRGLGAFAAAWWRRPGAKLTLLGLVVLGSIVVRGNGVTSLAITVAIALPIGIALGYREFRRTGEA